MNTQDYITQQLKDLHLEFGNLSFKYAICGSSGFHIIEVDPYDESMDDIAYVKAESKLIGDFRELYPMEDLYFSEPCDLNDMDILIISFFPIKNQVEEFVEISFTLNDFDLDFSEGVGNEYALAA